MYLYGILEKLVPRTKRNAKGHHDRMDDLVKRVAGMDVKDDNGPTFGGNVRVQKDDGTTFTQDGPTFGGSAHIVKDDGPTFGSTEWLQKQRIAAAMKRDVKDDGPEQKKKNKRKPKFSPAKYDATTTEEEKDDDIPEKDDDIPPPPPAPLEGLRSPTDPFTLTELEDMHKKIVQKCAPIIDGFSALNIFEVSYVEQKLKEIKSAFKKDYDRNNQYVKFFKKANKQGKTEGNADVKGGAKGRKKK